VAYVRKVRTASGAVQVVRKHRGQRTILAHVGSAHTDAQLGILLERARRIAAEDQGVLDMEVAARTQPVDGIADWRAGELIPVTSRPNGASAPPGRTAATHSRLLYDVLPAVYDWLGLGAVDDAVFRDLVIARIVEPTSKADAARVLPIWAQTRCRTRRFNVTSRRKTPVGAGMRSPDNASPTPSTGAG
jgi:hypothetical protein